MHRRISTTLQTLRQDLAAALGRDFIHDACRAAGHTWCATCLLTPAAIIHWFLVQVLVPATEVTSLWLGHRVLLIDGSSFSMPDVAALQADFGQPGNQAKGCGFPVAHILALFHAGTGLLLEVTAAPLRSHDMAGVGGILPLLKPGDVLVADRGFCSFAHLGLLICKDVHAVFRLHQKQIVDFTPGRAHARPGQKRAPKGMPRSRWIRALGLSDQVVEYFKPARVRGGSAPRPTRRCRSRTW